MVDIKFYIDNINELIKIDEDYKIITIIDKFNYNYPVNYSFIISSAFKEKILEISKNFSKYSYKGLVFSSLIEPKTDCKFIAYEEGGIAAFFADLFNKPRIGIDNKVRLIKKIKEDQILIKKHYIKLINEIEKMLRVDAEIPESMTVLDNTLPIKCPNCESLTLSSKVTTILPKSLSALKNLKKINFKGNINDWLKVKIEKPEKFESFFRDKDFYLYNSNGELEKLKIVNIDSSHRTVNSYQFYNIDNIEEIIIQDGLVEIMEYSFGGCKNLKKITLPSSIKKISENAFVSTYIEKLYFNGSLEQWKLIEKISNPLRLSTDFYVKDNGKYKKVDTLIIKNIDDFNNIDTIRNINLKTISFSNDLKFEENKEKLEFDCENISIIHCSTEVLSKIRFFIKKGLFGLKEHCELKELWITEGPELIYPFFYSFDKIEILKICNVISTIDTFCFDEVKVKNIYLNMKLSEWEKVKVSGSHNYVIDNVDKIYLLDENNEYIECKNSIFKKELTENSIQTLSRNKIKIANDVIVIPSDTDIYSMSIFGKYSQIENLELGDNVEEIKRYAFQNLKELRHICFSKKVKNIGWAAFSKNKKLSSVVYKGDIGDWCKIIFEDEESSPLFNNGWIEFVGIDGEMYEPTVIEVPDTIKHIGKYQFLNFSKVKEVTIKKAEAIGDYAFLGCVSLKKITIPNTVKEIGFFAFNKCKQLEDIYYEGTFEEWNNIKFDRSNPLENGARLHYKNVLNEWQILDELIVPEDKKVFDDNEYENYYGVSKIIISNKVSKIKTDHWGNRFSMFKNLRKLQMPYIPYTKNESFSYYPSSLKELIFTKGKNITDINIRSYLTKLVLPSTLEKIDAKVNYDIDELYFNGTLEDWCQLEFGSNFNLSAMSKRIYFLEKNEFKEPINIKLDIKEVQNHMFYQKSSLEKITFTKNVLRIGYSSFEKCKNLKEVIIKNENVKIDDLAFGKCDTINKLIIPNLSIFINNENIGKVFKDTKVESIFYSGNIEHFISVMAKLSDFNLMFDIKKLFIKNDDGELKEEENPISKEINDSCRKIFDIQGELNYFNFEIDIANCYVAVLKKSYSKKTENKTVNKNLYNLYINCFIKEDIDTRNKAEEIIEKIKEKYPYLLIRSNVYIVVSPMLIKEKMGLYNIFYYDDDYHLQEYKYNVNKVNVYSVDNIFEEFKNIEAKNSDAIDCVKAFTNNLDIYDMTQQKLDSIYRNIESFRKNNQKGRILIEGPARSGKTIIAFNLMNKYSNAKFLLMNYHFYRAIRDAFNAYKTVFPYDRIYHHDINSERSWGCGINKGDRDNNWHKSFRFDLDFVIVDEAQRLSNLPGVQGNYRYFPGFDELDLLLTQSNISIYLGDDNQRLNYKTENGGFVRIKQILNKQEIDFYDYQFGETIGIPTYLVNSVKYLLTNDINYKDNIQNFKLFLTNDLNEFKKKFDDEVTDKKHYAYVPGGNLSYDKRKLSWYDLSLENFDSDSDYFLNKSTQNKIIYSTYEMISRELDVLYLYIPSFISYDENLGIIDINGEIPQEFLLNHLYVNLTRATKKIMIYTDNKQLFDYLSKQIDIITDSSNEFKWKDLEVVEQKINYVLSHSNKRDVNILIDKIKTFGFEGFVHAASLNNVEKILTSNKLLSRNDSLGLFNDIADQGVICRTSEFVKSKVRFYYKEKTPTYYHFNRKVDDLIILQFDTSLLNDYHCYYSDGNAASRYSRITGMASEAVSFDWECIFDRSVIFDYEDKQNIIRKRDAELLVEGPINVKKHLKKIIVKDNLTKEKLSKICVEFEDFIEVDLKSFE